MDDLTLAGSDLAKAVLPILQRRAALLLEEDGAKGLAAELRAGTAGGCAIETMNQNTPDGLAEQLDTFWRVLCAFEECALGGAITRAGLDTPADGVTEPRPWMLHDAGAAIRTMTDLGDKDAAKLLSTADAFLGVTLPAYRPIAA